jgi:hypothetical protein
MEAMRDAWTDERLDDMSKRMDRDFDCVHGDIEGLRAEVRAQGAELRAEMKAQGAELRTELNERFGEMNARFDSMQRMTLAAYVSAVVGIVATQL